MGVAPVGVPSVPQHIPPHAQLPPNTLQHPPISVQQQLPGVNGGYFHLSGAPVGAGMLPPQPGGIPATAGGMYGPPGPGSVESPSTHMTELMMTTPGSQASAFTGVVSPSANQHMFVVMDRPDNLQINPGGTLQGMGVGDTSKMYYNEDPPSGEQVDFRQPPFTTVGGEDLVCGQGT